MTLAPADNWHEVVAAKGPALEPNLVCSHPNCDRRSTDGHHIWRRSFTGGPTDWVSIAGRTVANKTWLCVEHHLEITGDLGGHVSWIRWRDGIYWWYTRADGEADADAWWCLGAITPQPSGAAGTVESFDAPEVEPVIPDHICPECGKVHRHKHKPAKTHDIPDDELERLPARKATRIQITVPDDQQEDGADVVFSLLDDLSETFHVQHYAEKFRRYHTLVPILVFAQQHKHLIEIDMKGE